MNDIDFDDPNATGIPESKPDKNEPEKKEEVPEKKEEKKAEPEKKAEAKDDDADEFEEEFFTKADEKKDEKPDEKKDDPDAFNADKFDAETAKLSEGITDKKANEKFVELRGELKSMKQQLVSKSAAPEVMAELETLRVKASEADGLRQRLDEVSSISAKVKLEQSDKYDAEITKPAARIFAAADEIATTYELDPSAIRAIIKEKDRKKQDELIEANLEKLSGFNKSEVYRLAHDFRGLLDHRKSLLDNAEDELKKAEVKRVADEKKLIEDHRTTVQTLQRSIWDKYKDKVPGFVDDDGAPTDTFKTLMARAVSIDFVTSTPRDQAYAAFSGVVLPHLMKENARLKRELDERDKADGKEVKQRPKASTSIAKKDPPAEPKGDTFMERMANTEFSG